MKKKVISGAVVLALAILSLASTSASAQVKAVDETTCGTATGFCVGLVTDVGRVDDKSFNQSAWEGAKAAASALGGFSKYIETVDPKDYSTNIDLFAAKKYKVIVTVGFLMADATAVAVKKYPNIKFIGVDQFNGGTDANYSGLVFPEDKAGFMVGYLAGYLTKTNKVAAVLGTSTVPAVTRYGEGYKNGIAYAAKQRGKKIKTTLVYHAPDNAFNDPAWGATTAGQLLSQGFDVIFGVGGKTGNGALGKVAKKKNVYCIGVDTDQWGMLPEARACLVTSALKLINKGVQSLVKSVKSGSFKGGNFIGDAGMAPYHNFSKKVPSTVQKKVVALNAKVLSGAIPTGVK
jgi:basic membrane protein A